MRLAHRADRAQQLCKRGVLISTVLCAISVTFSASAREYYVAPDGTTGAEGTEGAPLASIDEAAKRAQAGDTVIVREGTYRESIRPAASGKPNAPIEFKAFDGEQVVISGADPVKGPWSETGGMFAANASVAFDSQYNQAPQVFVDGKMYFEARWPNTSVDAISTPSKATVDSFVHRREVDKPDGKYLWVFEDEELSSQPDLTGAKIYMQPSDDTWSWAHTGVITKHDGAQLSYLSFGGTGDDADKGTLAAGARYYVWGKKELLDSEGEWYHDGSKLHFIGPDPANVSVEVKQRDFAFDFSERSHIVVRGFHLFGSTITTDVKAGDGTQSDSSWRKEPNTSSKNVVIDGINGRYLSHATDLSGHFFGQWSQNTGIVLSGEDHKILNSVLQFSSGNGVSAIGYRHEVANNLIADVNYRATETGCIGDGKEDISGDQEWHHNTCLRTGRSGLQTRRFQNTNKNNLVARIHHNVIANYGLQDFDVGAFYSSKDGSFARIDHNVIYLDKPAYFRAGIYFDVQAENYIVDHNVVYNVWAGSLLTDHHGFKNILIYNNTLLAGTPAHEQIKTTGDARSAKASGSAARKCASGCLYQNNLLKVAVWYNFGQKQWVNHWPDYGAAKVVRNMVFGSDPRAWNDKPAGNLNSQDIYHQDVGFPKPQNGDYRLTAGSPAIDKGVSIAGLTRDGVSVGFEDAPDGKPDIGAFEHGQEPWVAGSSLDPIEYLTPTSPDASDPISPDNPRDPDNPTNPDNLDSEDPSSLGGSDGECACQLERTTAYNGGWFGWLMAVPLALLFRRRSSSKQQLS